MCLCLRLAFYSQQSRAAAQSPPLALCEELHVLPSMHGLSPDTPVASLWATPLDVRVMVDDVGMCKK